MRVDVVAHEYLLSVLSATFTFTGWSSCHFSQALNAYREDDRKQTVSQYDVF